MGFFLEDEFVSRSQYAPACCSRYGPNCFLQGFVSLVRGDMFEKLHDAYHEAGQWDL
ncbi:hypothetical protein HanPSC8_Chr09g0392491 [Helianthus annuus]|nr:hypothetical protein HanPSC8_Chr09g0392491 [Helianthus annuus]